VCLKSLSRTSSTITSIEVYMIEYNTLFSLVKADVVENFVYNIYHISIKKI
jgi:hypothetical protein